MLRLALTQAPQIVGEAPSKVSTQGRGQAPGVDWAVIVDTRNRLAHAYFDGQQRQHPRATVTHTLPDLLHQLACVEGLDRPAAHGGCRYRALARRRPVRQPRTRQRVGGLLSIERSQIDNRTHGD